MVEFFIGVILGIIFFGGLYWTVQNLPRAKHPALLMTVSLFFRMGVTVGTFFYVAKGGYKGILLVLAGMLAVRIAMTFTIKNPKEKPKEQLEEKPKEGGD